MTQDEMNALDRAVKKISSEMRNLNIGDAFFELSKLLQKAAASIEELQKALESVGPFEDSEDDADYSQTGE